MNTQNQALEDYNRGQKGADVDPFTEERYQQFCRWLPPGCRRILDIGCGPGRGGRVVRAWNSGVSLVGLDCVPERVAAIDQDVYSETVCGFAENLPFEDRSFDAVLAGEFFEHVPADKIDAALCECFRILKLRGVLLLTTPNPNYLRNKWKKYSVMTDPAHVTQHFPDALRARLRAIGYSRIVIRGSGKVSRYLGTRFPLSVYGSYLCKAVKW